jgi:LacI family transcriptional regulator
MPSNSRMTIAEVAEKAGVSRTTVSHVISGNRPVAAMTREKVERVIREMGYRPNGLARSLRIQRTHTIALVIPDINNPFYPVLARGLDDVMGEEYRTLICNTDAIRERELAFVADVFDRKVDGMVIVAFQIGAADLDDILGMNVPVVSIGDNIDDQRVDIVLTDDEHGAYEATRYLLDKGHRRVGLVGGAERPGLRRMAGYRRALDEIGIPFHPELAVVGGWTRQGGKEGMSQLLALDERPDAVFCANDLMAIGAIDAARHVGLAIPDDIAIVGYDDIEAAAMVTPPLTTITNPAYEAGQTAGRLLLDRVTGAYGFRRRRVVLRSELIERESA